MPKVAVISFRLGGTDGVSIESAKWAQAFRRLGYTPYRVAGRIADPGPEDHVLPGLAIDAREPPTPDQLDRALAGADLVVVENLCSLPLNPAASAVTAKVLHGRPAILHHHDLPWERPHFAHHPPPPDDPAWRHVTINEIGLAGLADHGIDAVTLHNSFDLATPPGNRDAARDILGVDPEVTLVLQPTRAIPRKNVAAGIHLAESLHATYWLLGPAEDGYGPELDRLLDQANGSWRHGNPGAITIADAYAAADVVTLPSTWEGFGNPTMEATVHRRPLAVGPYPVAQELARFGFEWFDVDDPAPLAAWLAHPDLALIERNRAIVAEHFSIDSLPVRLSAVLDPLI